VSFLSQRSVTINRKNNNKITNHSRKTYKESEVLKDHTNFVSAVCVFNQNKWLATASNDKTICIYIFGCATPFATLTDHTNTVCALAQGAENTTLISGSWDQTARIWNNLDVGASSIELKGHEAAVWAVVALKSGKYATGSADKTIFVWNPKGEKLVVLKGHTDCVRGLVGLEDGSLLSCSNDATIRHWSDTYDCLKEFHGHSNYIYSIALNPAFGDTFVTGSEDSSIRLWSISKGALGDAMSVPAQSVWTIACTPTGDIVAGTSDATVRVFTKDADKVASPDVVEAYNTAVQTRQAEQSKELGGVKVNDLPGPESLMQDGTEGQTRLVRQPDGKILCYQWTKGTWACVGDVMGASGGTTETSGKSLHEGKEYDFVFNVDIEDGAPPLKLPFNRTDDPWLAAQKFIHKNDLPQVYLEQVANFIIKNANLSSLPPVASAVTQDFADPFTGEGRYIPSTNGGANASNANVGINFRERSNGSGVVNVDPFTAGDSYSSGKIDELIVKKHIPCVTKVTFDAHDATKICAKIKEFNGQLGGLSVADATIDQIVELISKAVSPDEVAIKNLETMLTSWPEDKLFPVLDVARLVVRNSEICSMLSPASIELIINSLVSKTPPNQLMASRALSNVAVSHVYGKNLIEVKLHEICDKLSMVTTGNSNLQIAFASFFLNQSILQKGNPSDEICTTLTIGIVKMLEWISEPEATFRAYQAMGNLVSFNKTNVVPIVKTVDALKQALERNRSALYPSLAEISVELGEKLM
jgi:phospholipase A-2-activating protein